MRLKKIAKANNFKIDGWIEETISGTKDFDKRQLGVLLKKVLKKMIS